MKTYRSPVYPALMINIGDGRKAKAAGGYFEVEDEDVDAFEAIIKERPQYRIVEQARGRGPETDEGAVSGTLTTASGDPHGTVKQPEPMSESEMHPENVSIETLDSLKVPELRERLEKLGLDSTGRKAVLVNRLAEATNTPTGDPEPEDDDAADDE